MFTSIVSNVSGYFSVAPKYTIGDKTFTFDSKIAEGGYAFVEKIKCDTTGKFFALKRMNVHDENLIEATKQEIKLWKSLGTHPNIVKYLGSSYDPKERVVLILSHLCPDGHLINFCD